MAGEYYHTLYSKTHGTRAVSLRLTNTYGPRMFIRDARQTFLEFGFDELWEGGSFEVWGGEQERDLTFVEDVVGAFLAAGTAKEAWGQV